jgi:uridylate kinase
MSEIFSPITARLILPSSIIENTFNGMLLSIQNEEAVESLNVFSIMEEGNIKRAVMGEKIGTLITK